ncbi:uncharacterized protein LOC129742202 [Uranotaenia lowii]|uniref:uncharacterized protein LOC129742202 n=1 Tax=Uranotaenia lowii TaxID=190385 RepID=UPI002478AF74|nr:uncharacterized protein LOC129742202 [Uranotaenia lowii]
MAEAFSPWGDPAGPSSRNSRTLPSWLDPMDKHGEVQYLNLKAANDQKLTSNPFIISKSIDQIAGRIEGVSPPMELIDGTPVFVESHPTKNTCQSVVSCREVADLKEEDICEALQDQKVVKVYRFTRKIEGKTTPTNTLVLTFSGTVPPTHVWFGYLRVATRPYYPRPMQCLLCGKFGHTKSRCPNQPICPNCGGIDIHKNCPNPPHCNNCLGPHPTTSRSCSKYLEEQSIIRIRIDRGLTHSEAIKEYKSRINSQSNLQARINNIASTENNLQIKTLEKQIAELLKTNQELQAKIAKLENQICRDTDDSDSTLTDTNSNTSMDTTDDPPSNTSTPKRGRGIDSPESVSPINKKTRTPPSHPVPKPVIPNFASKPRTVPDKPLHVPAGVIKKLTGPNTKIMLTISFP